jgi:hypothetical protein
MKKIMFLGLAAIMLASCSAEKKFNRNLQGEWNVSKYAEKYQATGESAYEASNIGIMTFNKNGTGSVSATIRAMQGTVSDTLDFTWKNDINTVSIFGSRESKFTKSWIVIENKKKSQVWRSTDGEGNTQSLELSRKPKK